MINRPTKSLPKAIIGLLLGMFSSHAQISYVEAFPNIGFNFPVELQNANDGTNRLFVVEQPGRIKVFPNNPSVTSGQVSTFLDISSKVDFNNGQELGLLGLAFHPNFSANRYVYVYYTDFPGNYRINISRFQVSASNPNFVDPATESVVLQFTKNQNNSNHNGGKIAFGPDGYLYVSVGDGGGSNDPNNNAQNLNVFFGSILRIDVDNPSGGNNYGIPPDNPRLGQSGLDELYAWGIRNTWKFSFDGSTLWGADVGQAQRDEINIIQNGGNYGWRKFEGDINGDRFSSTNLATEPHTPPIFAYDYSNGDRSVTGGYVYRGVLTNPLLQGKYIFGDYVSGRVWSLDYNFSNGNATRTELFRTNGQFVSSFGLDESGELYFSDYGNSVKLYKIVDENTGPVTTPVNGEGAWVNQGVPGSNGTIEIIMNDGTNGFYVGGEFTNVSGTSANNLAKYTKSGGWEALGSGTNGKVSAIAIDSNGNIYVGGSFTQIDGVSVSNIAVWNGTAWSALGSGTDGPVSKIGIDTNDNVYVGGAFQNAGGTQVSNIALWNGSWNALTDSANGISGTNNEIRSIAFDENGVLYVGGNFDSAGGNTAPRIATWNGSNWGTLGSGTSGFVQAILVRPNYIYAGGNFAIAGGGTVNRIARWNRTSLAWESLDFGLSGNVNTLAYDGTFLYAGGSFETASDVEDINKIMSNIARWSEANGWEALGTNTDVGVSTGVNSISFNNDNTELSVGGIFSGAGAINADNIAIWRDSNGCVSFSITPQYEINGVVNSGDNTIEVTEGDTFTLGIVQDLYFSITLPDTTVIVGDYDFGNVETGDSGTYTFSSTEGCTETFELIVNADPNTADDDNDGVVNSEDNCPNTPNGESVDANGCSQSQLDDDNDGVSNADDICPNTSTDEVADSQGCGPSQQDIDNDGVPNSEDQCNDTPEGESVDTNGCAESQLDADGDGVPNGLDRCPDTPLGTQVDNDGCVISAIPPNNFRIATVSTTCRGVLDGQISINTELTLSYSARLVGTSFSETMNFNDNLIFDNLPADSFELCITAQEFPDYEMCATVVVDAPEPLSVFSEVVNEDAMVNVQMSGAAEYFITLNESFFKTSTNKLQLRLREGKNILKITTGQECQGTYEETVFLFAQGLIYPNPFSDSFFLNAENFLGENISLSFYTIAGQLIAKKEILADQSEIEIDTTGLVSGVYLVTLTNGQSQQTFKLVKQ